MDTEKSLFEEFPPVSTEEWEKVIEEDLGGADYREKLKWDTGEGVDVQPFYRREELEKLTIPDSPVTPGKRDNNWQICQPIFDQEVTDANKSARTAIKQGADALKFEFRVRRTEGMLGGDLQGTAIQSQSDFTALLEGVELDAPSLNFDSGIATPALVAMLQNEVQARDVDPKSANATFLYDPYAYTAQHGQLPKPEKVFLDDARQMVSFCKQNLPHIRCLGIDARLWHNTGGTIIEELALALATGSEYLAKLSERGLSIYNIASQIFFSFSIGGNYFLEIAKFRAARLLWAKVVEAYGETSGDVKAAYIHGETSRRNKTVYDPYTNMLRTSTEGMSAAIAGCDLITINPYDITFQQPSELGQRIARNAQIIFKEEAYLDQVYDPGAGSYYIEVLTDKIANAAWQQFQEIEKQGGMLKAITQGVVAQVIQDSAQKRDQAIAERGRIFVGTNQYPNAEERMAESLDVDYKAVSLKESDRELEIDCENIIESLAENFDLGGKLGDVVPVLLAPGKQLYRAVEPYRGTEPFERLRMETEQHSSTPTVLIIPLGNRKMRKARATFASNFLGCAGYEIKEPIGFEDIEAAIREIEKIKPEIAVFCSSDKEYQDLVEPFCKRLDSLKKKPMLLLAGHPKEHEEEYCNFGVDGFIHRKSNVLETLRELHKKLGIGNANNED
ncbi:methylmalonyl-CoA mutase family protein [Aliifodinibius sp. S!AR15-10]|uniref:methylmalonyl-CoA mutase family protein n=1 Tax=Aliifodinibius sp. S!AR15-10 TaxID=2950437 RepID=UPI002862D03B|nr:methylmalonyl-CoA mutase family protein [Aliifodinibius sp. S!AR15-10]MDR8393005.1 methylmalonyl-CoA mutase family protein [Aliifodinibius sp. S!AR15-10]